MSEPVRAYDTWEVVIYRGDEIIDTGTIREIAERRGILKATLRWYLTKACERRYAKHKGGQNRQTVVRV